MKTIEKSIEEFILRKYRSDKRVQLQPFNSATIITYVDNMAIAEHRDQDFKKDGHLIKLIICKYKILSWQFFALGIHDTLILPSIK